MAEEELASTLPSTVPQLPLLVVKPGTATPLVEPVLKLIEVLARPSIVLGENGANGLVPLAAKLVVGEPKLSPEPQISPQWMVVPNVLVTELKLNHVILNAVLLIVATLPGAPGQAVLVVSPTTETELDPSTETQAVVVLLVMKSSSPRPHVLAVPQETVLERTGPALATVPLMELMEPPSIPLLSPKIESAMEPIVPFLTATPGMARALLLILLNALPLATNILAMAETGRDAIVTTLPNTRNIKS